MPTSSKDNLAIRIRNLSKSYSLKNKQGKDDRLIALDNISLDIKQGEAIGIIGPNGSGKSTLLKILSEITAPDSGTVEIKGKVASILEVGTGFNPDLSGRKNIYLNARLHGMKKAEVNAKFEQIVDLFGFPNFLDTPVKHYSSGMYMRLAFAVVVHIDADIYLFDEVLSVGDVEFQKKALGIIEALNFRGKTILFVTHAPAIIAEISHKMVLMNAGSIETIGIPHEIIYLYNESFNKLTKSRIFANEKIIKEKTKTITSSDIIFKPKIVEIRQKNLRSFLDYRLDWSIQITFKAKSKHDIRLGVYFMENDLKRIILSLESNDFTPSQKTQSIEIHIPKEIINQFSGNIGMYLACGPNIITNYPDLLKILGTNNTNTRKYQSLRGYLIPNFPITFHELIDEK